MATSPMPSSVTASFPVNSNVLAVPLHAQHQRLQPPYGQVGVEWTRHRACPVLQESERGVQLFIVGDQRTTHHVGVPADVFGGRVQHHVSAEGQRLLQRGRGEGVVHQHLRSGASSQLGDHRNVGDEQQWVGGGLHPDQPGLRGEGGALHVRVGQRTCHLRSPLYRVHLIF